MKKFRLLLAFFLTFLLVSCVEVNEDIVIDASGSGTYSTKTDMGTMFEMIRSMGGDEELAKNGMDRAIDTIILMKNLLDSAKNATPEQKRLLAGGKMNLKMNAEANLFKIDINFPFKNLNDLQKLMSDPGFNGIDQVLKSAMNKNDSAQSAVPIQDQSMGQMNNVFDIAITKNSISRALNKQKYDALMDKPEMAQMKQMGGSGMEIWHTTTIRLPRPVKKSDNPLITLSSDKKTATLKYDLLKMIEAPEKFSYSIEY